MGLKRAGFSSEDRSAIRRALFALFKGKEPPRVGAETLLANPRAEVAELARFVLECPRHPREEVGLHRPNRATPRLALGARRAGSEHARVVRNGS